MRVLVVEDEQVMADAIADGLRAPGLQGKLDELDARRVSLEAEIASGAHPELPRLHPNLSEVYRERLREAIAADRSPEFVESVRALIERVEVHPGADGERSARIELVGHLASMLRLSSWMRGQDLNL